MVARKVLNKLKMTPWLTWIPGPKMFLSSPDRVSPSWLAQPPCKSDTWGRKRLTYTQGRCILIPECPWLTKKFWTSVLCLLHMDTNLPSGFPASSPSSLQSMWLVSKSPLTQVLLSSPNLLLNLPVAPHCQEGQGLPSATAKKWQQSSILAEIPPTENLAELRSHGVARAGPQLSTRTHTCKGRYVARVYAKECWRVS